MKKKAIIVSGYFNPLHKGHIDYFNNAKALCDVLFVIVNNDHQRELKGSKPLFEEKERLLIVSNIKAVDKAILSVDKDRTVCESIRLLANCIEKIMIWLLPMAEIKTTRQSLKSQFVRSWR